MEDNIASLYYLLKHDHFILNGWYVQYIFSIINLIFEAHLCNNIFFP